MNTNSLNFNSLNSNGPSITTRTGLLAVMWAILGAAAVTLIAWMAGLIYPTPLLAIEAVAPFTLLAVWPVAVVSCLRRRWVMAGVSLLCCGAHLSMVIPLVTAQSQPEWAHDAPTLSLASTNVMFDNEDKAAVARRVLEFDTDVVIVNEITPAQREAFLRAGVFEKYPYVKFTDDDGQFGELLMSRLPVESIRNRDLGTTWIVHAKIRVGSTLVNVIAQHTTAPKRGLRLNQWTQSLRHLGEFAASLAPEPVVIAGDFNSSPMHGPFRDLLATGLSDAHQQRGLAWTPSWGPDLGWASLGPIIRLDHAVVNSRMFTMSLTNEDMPGSDHVGFVARFAVQPAT